VLPKELVRVSELTNCVSTLINCAEEDDQEKAGKPHYFKIVIYDRS